MISEANSLLPSPLWSGSVSAGYRTNDLCSGLGTVTLARAVLPQRLRNPRFSSFLLSLSVSDCCLSLAHRQQVGGDSTLRGPLNAPVRSNCSSRARCLLPAGSCCCLSVPRAALIGQEEMDFLSQGRQGYFPLSIVTSGDHVANYIPHGSRDLPGRSASNPKTEVWKS